MMMKVKTKQQQISNTKSANADCNQFCHLYKKDNLNDRVKERF